jgi:hypothetical protein
MTSRRPLYGGERGIRNRGEEVTSQLRTFAKSDFMHDFGEGVDTRDKFTQDDNVRFIEIAQRYGVGKVKAAITGFNSVLNENPFKLIGNNISEIYPGDRVEGEFLHESDVLLTIGLDYDSKAPTSLKNQLKAKKTGDILKDPIILPNIPIKVPGGTSWTYEVRAVPMKVDRVSPNLSTLFNKVTGGKTKFAIIIDAAGGLSMTSLKNSDLNPLPDARCSFHIIENIENDSDSATKLKNFDTPKIVEEARVALAPEVRFVKDVQDTVVYPPFQTTVQKDPGEALFGNATLVLSRAGGEMEADFTFEGDSTPYHIENVSQNANVKNASLNLLASAIGAGFTIDDKKKLVAPEGVITKEPFLYPYIKRVGDWCQALSLLDTSREYQVYDENHQVTSNVTTLKQMKEDDTVVALVTLDRILLAYALSLGIDVFFTTASDLSLLLYFKNTETELTPEQLDAKVSESMAAVAKMEAAPQNRTDNSREVVDAAIASVKTATDDVEYIARLRAALYRVSVMRSDFANLTSKVAELDTKIQADGQDNKVLYDLYFDKLTILRKMDVDHAHNATQIAAITTYPDLALDRLTYDTMRLDRPSRSAISRMKTIISKDMFNDALQAKEVFMAVYREPSSAALADVWKAFGELKAIAGPQTGGGPGDILRAIQSLHQFEVTPLPIDQYNVLVANPEQSKIQDETLPLTVILGSFYRDKKSLPYTVINNFVITKEDLLTFDSLFADMKSASPEQLSYLTTRFILLYADILRAQYEKLVSSEDNYEIVDNDVHLGFLESDTKFTAHKRIHYQASTLQEITAQLLVKTLSPDKAFTDAYSLMKSIDLLDDEQIVEFLKGRGGLRNNAYTQTCNKIETVRIAILKLAGIPTKPFPACRLPTPPTTSSLPSTKRGREDATMEEGREIRQRTGGNTHRRKAFGKKTRKH